MMKKEPRLKLISIFTAVYLVLFTIITLIYNNYEFLYYIFVLSILIGAITYKYKNIHLTPHLIISLSILGFMHFAGGTFHLFGTRLYDLYLIKNILKYDNLVHSFGIFIATIVGYNLLKPHLSDKVKNNKFLFSFILILIAMGTGAFVEIIELIGVAFLGAAAGVGDYFNNALDLVFNLVGSIIASIVITYHRKKELEK